MKTCKELVDKRRNEIMLLIQEKGHITVEELEHKFQTSKITIRRDLQFWEEKGAIKRIYGGAKLIQNFVNIHESIEDAYKHAIARYAAQYVENGDIIFINTSSTALLMIKYIKNKQVTIVTNNAKAIFVEHDPSITIVLTGGELRYPKESMVGDFALNTLNKVTANKCFLGCSGIDIHSGMSTAILQEVSINETMIKRCKGNIFLLADYTKIGNVHQFIVTDVHSFNYIITDNRISSELLSEYKKENINIITLPQNIHD